MTSKQADISRGSKLSGIWIIPLLALALGIYLVVNNWLTQGPEIEIAFKTAEGLEQGQTRVKYRNVDMGVVQSVRLNDSFDGVIARVKLDRQALPLLRKDSRFWVVTARIGAGSISGLETLLSGAYIQLAPGTGTLGERRYVALEQPPLTPIGAPGLRLQLTSERPSSVTAGDVILYKGYTVGRVESMDFDPAEREVRYVIFIDAPFHELVNSAVRFWDVSGFSLSAGADGFKVETGSIESILLGGVTFGLPAGIVEGTSVEHNTEFELYPSYEDILKNPYRYGSHYIVSFEQSVKGLEPGAPVEYRGLPVGRVEKIMLRESIEKAVAEGRTGTGGAIPVLIYLEPARLALPDHEDSVSTLHNSIKLGVTNGMRASMEIGSFLTGAKYIDIDYFSNVEEADLGSFLGYPTIPTIDTGLGQLQQKVTSILDMINALPLHDTVQNANAAIASLHDTLQSLDEILENQETQQLPAQLNDTLEDLSATLSGLSPGSEINQSISSSLLRLNRMLGNLEAVTDTLSSQPNALILPSDAIPDPIPEAKK